jgi:predicted transcriptional regulator
MLDRLFQTAILPRGMTEEAKITTTVRLRASTKLTLDKAAAILDRSHSSIVEEALLDLFNKYNLTTRYQVHVSDSWVVLAEINREEIHIKETRPMNGKSPQAIQQEYALKLQTPVALVKEKS